MVGGVFGFLGKLKTQIHDAVAVVAGIHLERVDGAANQHASGDHERERHGDLRGDEEIAQPAATNGRSSCASDRGEERGAGTFNGRREAKQDARKNRYRQDVCKYFEVGVYVQHQRAIFGRQSFGGFGYRYTQQVRR